MSYEPDSFVGNNLDDETAKRGFTGQPNILFWEAHTDVGGPIKRDKIWFYAAYNHFKIDKEISGVPRQFSDLGVFDNYTGKVSAQAVVEGHAGGLLPVGTQVQAAPRTVGFDRPRFDPRPGQPLVDVQRPVAARLDQPDVFSDLKVGLFGFGWPMTPAVDWTTNPPRVDTGHDHRDRCRLAGR